MQIFCSLKQQTTAIKCQATSTCNRAYDRNCAYSTGSKCVHCNRFVEEENKKKNAQQKNESHFMCIFMHDKTKSVCRSEIDDNTKLRGSNLVNAQSETERQRERMIAFRVYEKFIEQFMHF